MLAIMGGLLAIKSVAFAEDFESESLEEMERKYDAAVSMTISISLSSN